MSLSAHTLALAFFPYVVPVFRLKDEDVKSLETSQMYACANEIIYLIHSRSISLSTWDYPLVNTTAQRLQSWKSTTTTIKTKQVTFA